MRYLTWHCAALCSKYAQLSQITYRITYNFYNLLGLFESVQLSLFRTVIGGNQTLVVYVTENPLNVLKRVENDNSRVFGFASQHLGHFIPYSAASLVSIYLLSPSVVLVVAGRAIYVGVLR